MAVCPGRCELLEDWNLASLDTESKSSPRLASEDGLGQSGGTQRAFEATDTGRRRAVRVRWSVPGAVLHFVHDLPPS